MAYGADARVITLLLLAVPHRFPLFSLISLPLFCMFIRKKSEMISQLKIDIPPLEARLTSFIRQAIHSAGLQKAVIGLSGGVDSALVAFLCSKALGSENVHAVMLPYKTSHPDSLLDAQKVVDALEIRCERVEITAIVDSFIEQDPSMDHVRRGNAMARVRMMLLYDRSAREEALVVGTGNKTESLLGYSTVHGDAACAIAPLGNLYKTEVWELATHMGVPDSIIQKAPSADLWEGQTDEGELGFTYREVDALLYAMYEEKKDVNALEEMGFDSSFIENVCSRIARNRFKRELPSVPSFQ
jgi:NAD+ synthase